MSRRSETGRFAHRHKVWLRENQRSAHVLTIVCL